MELAMSGLEDTINKAYFAATAMARAGNMRVRRKNGEILPLWKRIWKRKKKRPIMPKTISDIRMEEILQELGNKYMNTPPSEEAAQIVAVVGRVYELQKKLDAKDTIIAELKATLDGDPGMIRTEEQRMAWRKSAINYADKLENRLAEGRNVAFRYAQIDGGHHRLWVIDQRLRKMLGDEGYADFVAEYESEDDYKWGTGIAP